MQLPKPPTTALEDRHYLNMSIEEYRTFAECVAENCYLNPKGDKCKIKLATRKKLKNIRNEVRKNQFLSNSMIWKEQLRIIQLELDKRQAKPRLMNA